MIGRESDGVSKAFIEAADKLVYLPMYGFSESLNIVKKKKKKFKQLKLIF